MEDLLKEWGFSELQDIFEEHEIDENSLLLLEEHHLNDIVPQLGKRVRLFHKIKAYQQEQNLNAIANVNENIQTFIVTENNELIIDSGKSDENISNAVSNDDDLKTAYKTATKRKLAFCGEENYKRAMRTVYNLDLEIFLQKTVTGQAILTKYSLEKVLSRQLRNKLAYVLISGLMSEHPSGLIPIDFEIVADKIATLFPTETTSTYYIPRIPGTSISKPVNAKGKLIDKYRNLRRSLVVENTSKPTNAPTPGITTDEADEELKTHVQWLKEYQEPWDLVWENWKKTFPVRKINSSLTISKYMEEWPILKHRNSYELVLYDYENLFPDSYIQKSLITSNKKWENFFESLMGLYELDKATQEFLAPLESQHVSQESKNAIQIASLPMLFPPKTKVRGLKVHWKPSASESQGSIINLVSTAAHIEECIKERQLKLAKLHLTMQPFLIVVGDSYSSIKEAYLIIDDCKYKATSVLQGFDFLFKAFTTFNAKYPVESENVWLIVEKGLYRIESTKHVNIPSVLTVLRDLKIS